MIKDITLGQYISGNSLIHRADPRVKIVILFILMISVFFAKAFFGFVSFAAFLMIIVIGTGLPVKHILKGLRPIMVFIILAALINIFTVPGTEIYKFYFIRITKEGIITAAKMASTLSMVIIIGSVLTLTTTPISLTDGIENLMSPLKRFKIPVHEIAMMMSIALRFIPTLLEETDKIMKAQSARGADFETGNMVQRAKSFIPVLVPLFISAFRRADQLATAMEARCYRGSAGRTKMKQLKLTQVDLILTIITTGFMVIFYYINN